MPALCKCHFQLLALLLDFGLLVTMNGANLFVSNDQHMQRFLLVLALAVRSLNGARIMQSTFCMSWASFPVVMVAKKPLEFLVYLDYPTQQHLKNEASLSLKAFCRAERVG